MKKKFASMLILIVLFGSITVSAFADTWTSITPWDYQKLLGCGMDVDWSKTKAGREAYNVQAVQALKAEGVSHVRIRISDDATDTLLQGLELQITDCLNNGMVPIIAYQADALKNEPTEQNIRKVVKWWGTVATKFQDKSDRLAFDLLIEATDALNTNSEKLNEIYERVVSEIRKTNPNRILLISPRLRSDAAYLSELEIPTQHNGYLMAEWHFYASGPSKENERKLWTTGTAAEKKLITDKIELAVTWQKKTGIPTWVGAWMPGNYNDGNNYSIEEQCAFADFMVAALKKAGIPFAINSDTKFYDREANAWISQMKPVFQAIFSANKSLCVGFNVKAILSPLEQCTFLRNQLRSERVQTDKIWLRLNGGTISQKTAPADWSDETILQWAQLQQEFGCSYIFVVNFNDTPENQLAFYSRLLQGGIRFAAIELGNEQYLPKFAASVTGKDAEVTARTANMTPQKYIQMCNSYIALFEHAKLPFYLQFAPQREDKNNYTAWNQAIGEAINSDVFHSQNVVGAIHLYERDGAGTLDAKQINSIRALVKQPIQFAVTEFGVADNSKELTYHATIAQEKELTNRILAELREGDILLNQILYTDYKEAGPEVFHSQFNGVTPKGKMILELFRPYW